MELSIKNGKETGTYADAKRNKCKDYSETGHDLYIVLEVPATLVYKRSPILGRREIHTQCAKEIEEREILCLTIYLSGELMTLKATGHNKG